MIECFTDGAYSASRNLGGVGIVFVKEGKVIYQYNKRIPNTTNNRCELYAVIKTLQAISKPIDFLKIYSDSQYVIGSVNNNWQRKKNQDLWELFDKYLIQCKQYCNNIEFIWIKGHQKGDSDFEKYNRLADALAVESYL